MSLLLSNFYPLANAVLTTGSQNINGIKTFRERIVAPEIRGSGLGGSNRKIDLQLGQLYAGTTAVSLDYWNRILSGSWKFNNRPEVNGSGVLLRGEASEGGGGLDPFLGNRQIKRVPAVGSNYGGTTISGFLNNMFFPYISGTVTQTAFRLYRYGYDSITGAFFEGTINSGDDQLTGISYLNNLTTLSGPLPITNNTYNQFVNLGTTVTSTTPEQYRSRIFVLRENTPTIINSNNILRIRFEPVHFRGVSTVILNQNNILDNLSPTNVINYNYPLNGTPSEFIYTFTVTNHYINFVIPVFNSPADSIVAWPGLLQVGGVVDQVNGFDYSEQFIRNSSVFNINFPQKGLLSYRLFRSDFLTPVIPNTVFTLKFKLQ
jgi:hypothetical protein